MFRYEMLNLFGDDRFVDEPGRIYMVAGAAPVGTKTAAAERRFAKRARWPSKTSGLQGKYVVS